MPPRTRKSRGTAASANQPTLSFNNSSKITKSSAADTAARKAASKAAEIEQVDVEEIATSTTAAPAEEEDVRVTPEPESKQVELTVRASPRKQAATLKKKATKKSAEKNEREAAAEKITDAQLKKYWQVEEDARLAPRVHQAALSLHERILRHFDLSSQFGPCIGISRMQRWKRANMLGLEPPVEVFAVLLREEDKKTSQGCGRLAYIDELGGGRVGIVD